MTPLADRPTPITDKKAFYEGRGEYVSADDASRLEQALAATVEEMERVKMWMVGRRFIGKADSLAQVLAAVSAHVKGE